jgi:predicted DNA-binding protein
MKKDKVTGTMTIRLSAPLERRLVKRAKNSGTTPSSLVRSILEREMRDEGTAVELPTTLERLGPLVGSIKSKPVPAGRDAKTALEMWVNDRRR